MSFRISDLREENLSRFLPALVMEKTSVHAMEHSWSLPPLMSIN